MRAPFGSLRRLGIPKRRAAVPTIAITVLLASAVPAFGQPLSDPRIVEFFPSPDHNATLADGSPAVTRYVLEVYQAGATAPFHTVDMGKPAPDADGVIRYDFSTGIGGWPLPGGTYEATVAAAGPSGSGRSNITNQFTLSCAYTVTPTSANVGGAGGAQAVTVTTTPECAWTAASSEAWMTVTPTSSTGSGTTTLTVAANTTVVPRTGTATVAGQTVTITQAGVACSYLVAPTAVPADASGTTGSITIDTVADCAWTAASNNSWITVTAGASGAGDGTVTLTVAANPGAARTGTATVAGQTVTVTQAEACSFTVAPTSASVASGGGTQAVTVTTTTGCSWTAASSMAWITVSPTSGTGSGTTTLTVAANPGAARTGTPTVAGQTVMVTQAAVCTYTLSPTSGSFTPTGGNGSFTVTTQAGCAWNTTSNASWVTVTAGSGTGTGIVRFTVGTYTGTSNRTAQLSVGGHVFTVQQALPPSAPRNLRVIR
jgi:hypothetical protein